MPNLISTASPVFPWHLHPSHLFELGRSCGIEDCRLLEACGLSTDQLSDAGLLISWDQYRRMAELIDQHGPQDWALQMAERLTPASHGLLSLAIMNCGNWRQALDMMLRFKNLVTALFYITCRETDDYIILETHPEFVRDPLLTRFTQCFFYIIYQTVYQLSGMSEALKNNDMDMKICFSQSPPEYAPRILSAFHNNVCFSYHSNQMRLHKRYLDVPLQNTTPNEVTARNMTTLLQSQLSHVPAQCGELHFLHDQFRAGRFRLDECAAQFCVSPTTLKRRLQQAGTCFNDELTCYRMSEACFMLSMTGTPLADIASGLGYQDTGSFRRVFLREYGISPADFRSR